MVGKETRKGGVKRTDSRHFLDRSRRHRAKRSALLIRIKRSSMGGKRSASLLLVIMWSDETVKAITEARGHAACRCVCSRGGAVNDTCSSPRLIHGHNRCAIAAPESELCCDVMTEEEQCFLAQG